VSGVSGVLSCGLSKSGILSCGLSASAAGDVVKISLICFVWFFCQELWFYI